MTNKDGKRVKYIREKVKAGISLTKSESEFLNKHESEYLKSEYAYSENEGVNAIDSEILRSMFKVPRDVVMSEFLTEMKQRQLRRQFKTRLPKEHYKLAPPRSRYKTEEEYIQACADEVITDIRKKHGYDEH